MATKKQRGFSFHSDVRPPGGEKRKAVLRAYIGLVQKLSRHPTIPELVEAGIPRGTLSYHFANLANLREDAKALSPTTFLNIIDDDVFSEADAEQLEENVAKHKRFFVTTGVTGCKVGKEIDSVANWEKNGGKGKGMMLVLPVTDPASRAGWKLDKALTKECVVMGTLRLNKNLALRSIKLSAKQLDPNTGLPRMAAGEGSFIFGSPKQRMQMVATGSQSHPVALMTPGAITKKNYLTNRYMSESTGYRADYDHVMGGIIVEIVDDEVFHFRQVQFEKDGSFIDLGSRYHPDGKITRVRAAAFALGDYHSGETDPGADKAWKEVIEHVGVDTLVFHDVFNGLAINPHEKKKKVTRAQLFKLGKLDLEKEIKGMAVDITDYTKRVKNVVIDKSNHDLFLDRYLEDGGYPDDEQNFELAHELALALYREQDPLKTAAEKLGLKATNVRWLSLNEDFRVAGHELGAHGHIASDGRKGSLVGMETSYPSSTTAHTHKSEIRRRAWQLGTSSKLKVRYNHGSSSWVHASCLHYPALCGARYGARQMIHVIRGNWKA